MDGVLSVMVSGLEEELKARMSGNRVYAANGKSPSSTFLPDDGSPPIRPAEDVSGDQDQVPLPVLTQGADVGILFRGAKRLAKWVIGRKKMDKGSETELEQ